MRYFARVLLLTLGLGMLVAVLSFYPSQPAVAERIEPVRVMNTPLPVTGNFNLTEARTPWSTSCSLSTPGLYLIGECQVPPLPAGQQVVIQAITFEAPQLDLTLATSAPPVWQPVLAHQSGGLYVEWTEQVPAIIQIPPSGYGLRRTFPVTLYPDPSTAPTCTLMAWNVTAVAPPGGQNVITCYLEGYTVPLSTK